MEESSRDRRRRCWRHIIPDCKFHRWYQVRLLVHSDINAALNACHFVSLLQHKSFIGAILTRARSCVAAVLHILARRQAFKHAEAVARRSQRAPATGKAVHHDNSCMRQSLPRWRSNIVLTARVRSQHEQGTCFKQGKVCRKVKE
jgi:hypothetical protein